MRRATVTFLGTPAALGCRTGSRAWDRAPLAPALRLGEAVAAGEVPVLVVDAHTGAGVGPRYGGSPRSPC